MGTISGLFQPWGEVRHLHLTDVENDESPVTYTESPSFEPTSSDSNSIPAIHLCLAEGWDIFLKVVSQNLLHLQLENLMLRCACKNRFTLFKKIVVQFLN